jgi:hypothetical protein
MKPIVKRCIIVLFGILWLIDGYFITRWSNQQHAKYKVHDIKLIEFKKKCQSLEGQYYYIIGIGDVCLKNLDSIDMSKEKE